MVNARTLFLEFQILGLREEVRRTAVGNDTEDEIAVGTAPYPAWIGNGQAFLPLGISSEITQSSNDATFRSLGKFRDALSELAFRDGRNSESDGILAYLNWNELIHTSYFSVPSFTQLTAIAIANADGFKPAPRLLEGDTTSSAEAWLHEVGSKPNEPRQSA